MSGSRPSCTHHEGVPAIAVCSVCEGDICGECHGADMRGLAVCRECTAQLVPRNIPWETDEPGPGLHGFAQTVTATLTAPHSFFHRFAQAPHWGLAAIFGILCLTAGTVINTFWQKAFSAEYAQRLQLVHDELAIPVAALELVLFAGIPLLAVALYFLHTGLLYLTVRAFGVQQASWTLIARISGYSLAAYLLLIFPPIAEFSLGHFLMILWLFNLEVSALRHFYGMGTWKSMGAVIAPLFIFLFTL